MQSFQDSHLQLPPHTRDYSPVLRGVGVRIALRWHTQGLRQLRVAIIDTIMDGLQLVSIPLWLVTNKGWIKRIYPKKRNSEQGRKEESGRSLKQQRGREEAGAGPLRRGKPNEGQAEGTTHCCESAGRHN